ncbi:unnamed protein product, partial [Rotaria sp. Silwood2]
LKITNPNDPSDKLAIQIEKEEEQAIEELKQLETLQKEEKKKIEEIEEEKKKHETNLMAIDKKVIEKKNELK